MSDLDENGIPILIVKLRLARLNYFERHVDHAYVALWKGPKGGTRAWRAEIEMMGPTIESVCNQWDDLWEEDYGPAADLLANGKLRIVRVQLWVED